METFIDKSQAVRHGEELDLARLLDYLRQHIPELANDITLEQFPAGFSNLTYLLRIGDREVVLRRPPVGAKIKTAHDMGREYQILSHLYPVYKKVPRPLLFCNDESVLGVPFYVMERVTGVILRAQVPSGLELTASTMSNLSSMLLESLIEIHEVEYEAAGLGAMGSPMGYVSRQVQGWTKRYFNARTGDNPSIERLTTWLTEHQPADSPRAALIHNDYKYDNVVFSRDLTEVVAVLDWEMATIGDPLMDLGTTLGYWVDAEDPEEWQRCGFGLTNRPGSLTRREVAENYATRYSSLDPNAVFYYAYGLLKIAVIVQQIYYRYRMGLTRDPRFAGLGDMVNACGNQAERAVKKGRIDGLA